GRGRISGAERSLDPVMVGDRKVRQAAGGGRQDDRLRGCQAVEAGVRVAMQIDEGPRFARQHGVLYTAWTRLFRKKSKCSKARPVPSATQSRGFSATWQGTPVTCVRSLSTLRRSAPPPDMTMPLSMMSEESSGG